jgi:hypothetical protein
VKTWSVTSHRQITSGNDCHEWTWRSHSVPTVGITEDVYDSVSWIVSVKRQLPEDLPPQAKTDAGHKRTDYDSHGELVRHSVVMSDDHTDVHSRSATKRDDEEDEDEEQNEDEEENEDEDEDKDEDSDDENRCEHGKRGRCEECDFRGMSSEESLEKYPEISPEKGPEQGPEKAPGAAPKKEEELELTEKQRAILEDTVLLLYQGS